jgi:protein-S-isoprenylcysteine O-methyltransferase Ste14
MSVEKKNWDLIGLIVNRAIFRVLVTVMLVVFGWLAGWYLQGHSISSWRDSNYFTSPFRIGFLVFLVIETVIIILYTPDSAQLMDENARSWYHWRLVMWETLLVLAVFSDCMGILPIGMGSSPRWIGGALLLGGLLLYAYAGASRRVELQRDPEKLFPTGRIFKGLRFPETLAAIFNAFGTALVFNAWAGIFIAVVSMFIFVGFVNAQDKSMLKSLRSPWAEYQVHTKRIFPFIW